MKKKVSNQEILNKIAQKFNEKGFNKNTINEKDKEELKPVLREIYKEYQSFGGMEKSQKENWRKACFEIMQEFKKENKEETKTIQKDDNYKSTEKEENKKEEIDKQIRKYSKALLFQGSYKKEIPEKSEEKPKDI